MSDVAITNPATRIRTPSKATGKRRRRVEGGSVVGGSVDWEVDMGKGESGGHQPAMVRPWLQGAPVREAVVAGHTGDLDTALRLVRDQDPAVRAAALGALSRMGALQTEL